MGFSGCSFVVIGSYGGIGSTICKCLKSSGAEVLIAGKNLNKLEDLSSEISAPYYQVDASSFDQVDSLLEYSKSKLGKISGIVNCCGSLLLKPAHLTSETEYLSIIQTNLTTAFASIRSGAKAMSPEGGSILLISSAAAKIGLSSHEAIACAKAGIIGLTKSAAATYAAKNIRVNCIAPGLVSTPLTANITKNENALKTSISMHPIAKIGQPADIASGALWLLDPLNSWVTGQTLVIDGGLSTLKTRP
jgi:NAD(P)-dependent dehydrogenase (short-subunit alcohol dehydrogenase family)